MEGIKEEKNWEIPICDIIMQRTVKVKTASTITRVAISRFGNSWRFGSGAWKGQGFWEEEEIQQDIMQQSLHSKTPFWNSRLHLEFGNLTATVSHTMSVYTLTFIYAVRYPKPCLSRGGWCKI